MITDILYSSNILKSSCNFAIGDSGYSKKTFVKQLERSEFRALGSRNAFSGLSRYNVCSVAKYFKHIC